jgi:hypothetical protein
LRALTDYLAAGAVAACPRADIQGFVRRRKAEIAEQGKFCAVQVKLRDPWVNRAP